MRRLQRREILFIAAGAVFLFLALGAWLVQTSLLGSLERLDRQIGVRERELDELQRLAGRYRDLKHRLAALELRLARQDATSFLSWLDSLVSQSQVRGHLDVFQPQGVVELEGFLQTTVELQFSRVSLAQVTDLLRRLSSGSTVVNIKRLSLERRFEDPHRLDLGLVLASYRVQP